MCGGPGRRVDHGSRGVRRAVAPVGAGGMGQDLFVAIRKFYYTDVSAILLMIIVTVAILDVVSGRVRHRLARLDRGQ